MTPANLETLVCHCVATGLILEIVYHPDADPGDGRGWSVTVGDKHHHGDGSLDGAVTAALVTL